VRGWKLLLLACLAALVGVACGNNDDIELVAEFDDVIDLVPRHMVRAADVPIGTVPDVELTSDMRARVTMRVRGDTGLPADVRAEVKLTQVLGERYVELIPTGETGELSTGVIADTRVAGDLEELVAAGTDFLAYVAADQLSAAVHAGAIAFGGRGETFGSFLGNLEFFVQRYSARDDDILRLLDGLDLLLTEVTPQADVHTEALDALARSSRALEQEDERLLDALTEVQRLAHVGERIMREHREEIDNFWRVFRQVLEQVTAFDGALEGFLTFWPRHNLHVPNAVLNEHAQLWADFIFCDTDSEDRDDPSRSCWPPTPGERSVEHPHTVHDACDSHHEDCDLVDGTPPRTRRDGGPPRHREGDAR
jgi:phospholipid/cholesterol/gamma-HCH transport system substrate-binding protein